MGNVVARIVYLFNVKRQDLIKQIIGFQSSKKKNTRVSIIIAIIVPDQLLGEL